MVSSNVEATNERQRALAVMQQGLDELFVQEIKVFATRRNVLKQNLTKLCGVVVGQCTESLQAELAGDEEYDVKSRAYDAIWLLKTLKNLSAGLNKSVSPFQGLVNSLTGFYTLRQYKEENLEAYRQRFEAAWNTVTMNKGSITNHPDFNTYVKSFDPDLSDKDVNNKIASVLFISFADSQRFSGLW